MRRHVTFHVHDLTGPFGRPTDRCGSATPRVLYSSQPHTMPVTVDLRSCEALGTSQNRRTAGVRSGLLCLALPHLVLTRLMLRLAIRCVSPGFRTSSRIADPVPRWPCDRRRVLNRAVDAPRP